MINNFNLKMLDVNEVSSEEAVNVQGGNPWGAFFLAYVVAQVVTNPTDHWEALKRGFERGYDL